MTAPKAPTFDEQRVEAIACHVRETNKFGEAEKRIARKIIAADPATAELERLRQRVTELEGALRKISLTPLEASFWYREIADKALTPNAEGAK